MALVKLFHNVIRDCLIVCGTVFNGQTLNVIDHNGAGSDFIGQNLFQYAGRLLGDNRADTVTINDTDSHARLGRKVCLKGNLVEAYFGLTGLKSVGEYVF